MAKKVGQVIVEALGDCAVERCYGIVGDTLNHFTDAMRASGRIAWVHVRHEEAGAFAAGAEALLTGRLAVCAGSCGPGSLHFVNGLYEAHRNRAPVVLIATTVGTDQIGLDMPQDVDLLSVFRGCSVFCEPIYSPAQARRMTMLAAQAALNLRGAAVLVVPGDIMAAEAPAGPDFRAHHPAPIVRPSDDDLDRVADILNAGERVAIYGGFGCEHAHDEVVALGAALKAPIAHTSRAKDFLEHDNPFDVGMTGLLGWRSGYEAVIGCDTLLLLGCDFAWGQFYPNHARIVQVDLNGRHLGRRHPVELGLVGNVKDTAAALLPRLRPREDGAWLDACLAHVARSREHMAAHEAPGRRGIIHPQQVAALVDRHAAPDAVFTADGGTPQVWLLRHVRSTGRRRTIISLNHGTMAAAMPSALGAAKACPGRQVISFSGDGGLAMMLGDMLTAVQEEAPIKIVVFNNGTLGFVETEMKVEGLVQSYTDLRNPDFARLAEVIGFKGVRVERPEDLEAGVTAVLAHPGPALLDVTVNRFELVMPPTVEPSQVYATALYSARAVLEGRGSDVVHMIADDFVDR